MHNLGTVIRFEVTRTLKKKSFWILALAFPLLIAALGGIMVASNQATNKAEEDLKKSKFSLQVTDESGLVKPELLAAFGAQTSTNKEQSIADVKIGKVDAYFYYPKDIANSKIEVYGKDAGIFDNGKYDGVAKALLQSSVENQVSPDVRAIITNKVATNFTGYKNGQPYDGLKQMIFPGLFLVLFYFLISFFGGQMLTSTTEEKENRVIEMLLTTVQARTLIIGKILALIILAAIQGLLVILPVIIGYLLFHDKLSLPFVDLSSLPIDPLRIGLGFVIFAVSFLLFTGLLVAAGAAAPTAKEAGSFFGVFMMLIFGPFYAFSLYFSAPDAPIVKFLSLFPLTAPIPLLLRNAAGNLGVPEALLAIAILSVTAFVVLSTAIRIFRFGALEYSRKLTMKEIFSRR